MIRTKHNLLLISVLLISALGCSSSKMQIAHHEEAEHYVDPLPPPALMNLVIQGSIYELQGDDNRALAAWTRAASFDSTSPGLRLALAKLHQRQQRFDTAYEIVQEGLQIDSTHLDLLLEQALLSELTQGPEQAIIAYEALLMQAPGHSEARYQRARLLLQLRRFDEATQAFRSLAKSGGSGLSSDILQVLYGSYLRAGDIDSARQTAREWVALDPDNEGVHLLLGQTWMLADDTSRALAYYEQTLRQYPEFSAVRERASEMLAAKGDIKAAIALTQAETQLSTLSLQGHNRLMRYQLQAGDTTAAAQTAEAAIDAFPDNWRTHYRAAELAYDRQHWPLAVSNLERARDLAPDILPIRLLLAESYYHQDRLADAIIALEKTREIWPHRFEIEYMYGLMQRQAREDSLAFSALQVAISLRPDHAGAIRQIADIHQDRGQVAIADSLYERAIGLDSSDVVLMNNYSYALAERNSKLELALMLVSKALEADSQNSAFLDTKGWVLYRLGRYWEALEYIKKALALRDSSATVWEHLGDVHAALGDRKAAGKAWRQALDRDPERRHLLEKIR